MSMNGVTAGIIGTDFPSRRIQVLIKDPTLKAASASKTTATASAHVTLPTKTTEPVLVAPRLFNDPGGQLMLELIVDQAAFATYAAGQLWVGWTVSPLS